jgi:hypothetical protein
VGDFDFARAVIDFHKELICDVCGLSHALGVLVAGYVEVGRSLPTRLPGFNVSVFFVMKLVKVDMAT